MTTRTRTRALITTGPRPLGRGLVAAGGAAVLALGLGACGDTAGDEEGASVEDVQENEEQVYAYDGVYDTPFYDDQDSYVGEEVTLSADVNEVLDDSSFTIAGTDDTTVDEFLVVDAGGASELEPGLLVQVSGTIQQTFDVVTVEEDLDLDLDDDLYVDFVGMNYIVADNVDETVVTDD